VKRGLLSGTEGSLQDESAAALLELKVTTSFTPAACSVQNTVILITLQCELSLRCMVFDIIIYEGKAGYQEEKLPVEGKKVIRSSQHGFTQGKSCLTDMTACYDGMTI